MNDFRSGNSKPDINTFCSNLSSLFTNFLPSVNSGSSKIDLSSYTSNWSVMQELHKYDNSCLIWMLIIADVYNSIDAQSWNYSDNIRVFNIVNSNGARTNMSPTNGLQEQKFDIAFQQNGTLIGDEDAKDIFIFTDDNFSADQWEVEWDSQLHTNSTPAGISLNQWYDLGGEVGRATGMMSWNSDVRAEIKTIYDNVVDVGKWPTSW